MAAKWRSGIAYCHGLAGNGDFLLDAGSFWGTPATGSGPRTWHLSCLNGGSSRTVGTFGDQPGVRTPDFGVGLAGVLSFFLRLRHGAPALDGR